MGKRAASCDVCPQTTAHKHECNGHSQDYIHFDTPSRTLKSHPRESFPPFAEPSAPFLNAAKALLPNDSMTAIAGPQRTLEFRTVILFVGQE
jgi:hypothetical protein